MEKINEEEKKLNQLVANARIERKRHYDRLMKQIVEGFERHVKKMMAGWNDEGKRVKEIAHRENTKSDSL